jgi:hypothetical protein
MTNRKMEQHNIKQFEFLGEQVGPVEENLKYELLAIFKTDNALQKAFLLRARYEGDSDHVVLALSSTKQNEDLIRNIGITFGKIFAKDIALDIMYLNVETEKQAMQVAKPFYTR